MMSGMVLLLLCNKKVMKSISRSCLLTDMQINIIFQLCSANSIDDAQTSKGYLRTKSMPSIGSFAAEA